MIDRISELVSQRPEMQFNKNTASGKLESLFGNTNDFAIGMGMGKKLGGRPKFMDHESKYSQCSFMRHRMGG